MLRSAFSSPDPGIAFISEHVRGQPGFTMGMQPPARDLWTFVVGHHSMLVKSCEGELFMFNGDLPSQGYAGNYIVFRWRDVIGSVAMERTRLWVASKHAVHVGTVRRMQALFRASPRGETSDCFGLDFSVMPLSLEEPAKSGLPRKPTPPPLPAASAAECS